MAITEEGRHKLYTDLEASIGKESATVLMEHLPPVGWADVATKRDLDHFALSLKSEFGGDLAALRGEMAGLRGEIAVLRSEIGRGDAEVRAELHRTLRAHLLALIGANAAMLGAVVAAVKL